MTRTQMIQNQPLNQQWNSRNHRKSKPDSEIPELKPFLTQNANHELQWFELSYQDQKNKDLSIALVIFQENARNSRL